MINDRNRKYPRVYDRKRIDREQADRSGDTAINISGFMASGIAAGLFIGGIIGGYLLKRTID